ncbi:MAG: YsnF/AvaK domain-containing protein [Chloroflexota bacterium]|nr:YsnF/AvaK domain-containing protein [Chloroflexota bacterium]
MAQTNRSLVAGVFQNEANAKQAVADLQQAGFTDSQIRYSVHKGGAGILDSLSGLGFGQADAAFYDREFLAGRTVVTVMNTDHQQEAYDILKRNGAYDASSRTGQTANGATDVTTGADQKLRLHEEQLSATKQRVQAGEVGIHKEIISEEKSLNVPVSHEEVYIERHAVTGVAASPTDSSFDFSKQTEDIRVPVSAEQVQVTKQAVVREEINVGKRVVQENQQVTDTVRHEEARIDRTGNVQDSEVIDDANRRIDQ